MAENDTGLYQRYRPRRFEDVVGQGPAVNTLRGLLDAPHYPPATLFSGPSGCGKTTLVRILRDELGCSDEDFRELNCADTRGIDTVREIRQQLYLRPVGGKCRIWLLDEAHKLTNDAQTAVLKMLEDAPKNVHFFLCSTHPQNLIKTVVGRCAKVPVRELGLDDLIDLVGRVAEAEKRPVSDEVAAQIAKQANGSGRDALTLLEAVLNIEGEEEQLEAVARGVPQAEAIDLARLLFSGGGWAEAVAILRNLPSGNSEAEGVRHLVLGFAQSVMLSEKGNSSQKLARAYRMLSVFRYPFYDSGRPGLVAACWEVLTSK